MSAPQTIDPAQLLADLQAVGVRFWVEGGRVRFAAPLGRPLTIEQLLAVKRHNDELAALLEPATGEPP